MNVGKHDKRVGWFWRSNSVIARCNDPARYKRIRFHLAKL
ncbi:hypothetical protein [Methylomonas albis]|nr:hypothetical protein [Methylomonas albis]